MARRIRNPLPTPRSFRANIHTGPSKAASGTICLRKPRKTLPKLSLTSTGMVLERRQPEFEKGTNPEELVAAAYAGCFIMALTFQLQGAGYTSAERNTEAAVTLEPEGIFSRAERHWSFQPQCPLCAVSEQKGSVPRPQRFTTSGHQSTFGFEFRV
jgi:OsmC-like protein